MSFTQIVYESLASESLVEADILEILRKSQVRNNQARISGILLFKDRRFLQFIEGSAAEIDALYERIAGDPRHREIRILVNCVSEQLLMPTWAMAYTSSTLDRSALGETFVLASQQAMSICELLPENIARPFIDLIAGEPEAA